ncbi:MAG: response regulator [Deltaproteobacteria bacterium]|nr:response regulator [Deltaproteobacteria bacterium]
MNELPVVILMVEDNPGDVVLTREGFHQNKIRNELHVAKDGDEALRFLRREPPFTEAPRPDLILLDLNLPGKHGREVLAEIKADKALKSIPRRRADGVGRERDIVMSYDLHANCYITKPVNLDRFASIVQAIQGFWFSVVKLPANDRK